MVPAVRPLGPLSMARGCARIDSRPDTAKIGSVDRVEVHHARLLAVIGVRKTFPHGLGQVRRQRRRARVFRFTPDCRHVDQRWISSVWARIGLVLFWPNMEAHGSEASSRAGLLLVGYLASRCCVNHSVAGPAEASKSFT